uniref:Protein kinase domain-containing protein n=1 Tax=Rhodosorus marinus TaxID=101924 RepID=A0A7S0G832_9RHOD|mmetsp:Transcript_5401/g.7521  ORF Transcript_5401/g.7521 Transcript_5401/m.7521 type:complete len:540 (+) Transcript_5401:76-1695(+)
MASSDDGMKVVDDLGVMADEYLEEDDVEDSDVEEEIQRDDSFSKLSADSWLSVESEYDAEGDTLFFPTVNEELVEEEKLPMASATENAMAKASSVPGKSVLDCVVELLRGTRAQKKKRLFRMISEKWIWLGEDLASLMSKSKRRPDQNSRINLTKCRILRSEGNSIAFQLDRQRVVLNLSSPSEVKLWLTGLSCLVPRDTRVFMGNTILEERLQYDPLKDSWQGKPMSTRKRVNEYILLGGIGRGSFAKVKLAISTLDKRFYATKIMNKSRKSSFLSESNKTEVAILRKLRHPNIVKHRDVLFDEETDRVVLVVEYMARGVVLDSSKLQDEKKLSEEAVKEIMKDVVAGLMYLHAQRVVHRDIKPDNLLRAGDGTVKLGDFGEARMYDVNDLDSKGRPTAPGTPAFLAPEFCMSDRSPKPPPENYSADVWSLGATIYYMVYGRAPFIASSVFKLYDVICTEKLQFPSSPRVSLKLKDLLKMMLTKEPTKRATLDQVASHTWFEEPVRKKLNDRIKITEQDIRDAIKPAKWVYPEPESKA